MIYVSNIDFLFEHKRVQSQPEEAAWSPMKASRYLAGASPERFVLADTGFTHSSRLQTHQIKVICKFWVLKVPKSLKPVASALYLMPRNSSNQTVKRARFSPPCFGE